MVAVLGYTTEQIREAVRDMYTLVAEEPDAPLHFPVGKAACHKAGYTDALLAGVPEESLSSFAGVGCPFQADVIKSGDVVLDIGAGSGTDAITASKLVGKDGKVWALDLTPAMREKLGAILEENGISNVETLEGDAEKIPLPDRSVDVVTTNGVLNLVPNKRKAVREIFRVLKPGGHVQNADIVIASPVTPDCEDDPRLWAECVVGATVDENYLDLFRDAGFDDVEVLRDYDYFADSPSEETREVARQFGAHAYELRMTRRAEAPSLVRQWLIRLDPRRTMANVRRRGLGGMVSLGLAMVACYGTLGLVGLLSVMGVSMTLNEGLWAGSIVLFSALATLVVAVGIKKHGAWIPTVLASAGLLLMAYTMFLRYHIILELTAFALLGVAAYLDYDKRRWAKVSGGKSAGLARREQRADRSYRSMVSSG